jgi:hypothetical protein
VNVVPLIDLDQRNLASPLGILPLMTRDRPTEKVPSTDDDTRTKQAKRFVEEYVEMIREILRKLGGTH